MKTIIGKISYTTIAITFMFSLNAGDGWPKDQAPERSGTAGLQQRIDFGNSYIMGQSIKSGAVYLLHRKQSEIKSMLQYRQNYRQEILENFKVQDPNSADQKEKTHATSISGGTAIRD